MKACHMVRKLRHVIGSEDEGMSYGQKINSCLGVRR